MIYLEHMREVPVPNPTKPATLDSAGRVNKISTAVYKE